MGEDYVWHSCLVIENLSSDMALGVRDQMFAWAPARILWVLRFFPTLKLK